MTSGSQNGASGGGRQIGPWAVVALVGAVVAFITTTSAIMELRYSDTSWVEPVIWETTSAFFITLIAPAIGWAVRRWPLRGDNLVRTGLIHFGLTVPFSLYHIVAIWLSREAIYAAMGNRYGFFDDGVGMTILYEWRKDILSYAAIAAVYSWFQRRAEAPPRARPGDDRIEIRDGATAVFLPPTDVLWVEAAGNYVEFHTAQRTHLVRGTLAAWEARLTQRGFVRVHRARVVNRARIASIKPTPAGDVEITLDDGRAIGGSRRYRVALEAAPAA